MSTTPPADWYPDPGGSGGQRYWDGAQWTEQVRGATAAHDEGAAQSATSGTEDEHAEGGVTDAPESRGATKTGRDGITDANAPAGEASSVDASAPRDGGDPGWGGGPETSPATGDQPSWVRDRQADGDPATSGGERYGSSGAGPAGAGSPSMAQGGPAGGGYAPETNQQYGGGYGGPAAGPPPLADVGPRFLALILDGLISGALVAVVVIVLVIIGAVLASISDTLGVIVFIIGAVIYVGLAAVLICYQVFCVAGPYGQTIGMGIAGVRCVSEVDAQPIDRGKAFIRWLVQGFVSGWFLLGYIWALFDNEKRTWHDMIAGTRVVVAPKPGPGARNLVVGAFKGERQ